MLFPFPDRKGHQESYTIISKVKKKKKQKKKKANKNPNLTTLL
jgi:hypothetical protein